MAWLFVKTLYHHRTMIKEKPCIAWKNQLLSHGGTVQTCLTTKKAFWPRESNSWCKWVKLFKNEPSKICRRQPLKNLKWYGLLHPNIGKTVAVKIISHLSIFKKLWKIHLCQYFGDDNLLSRCLEIGVASADINFNDEVMGLNRIFQSLDLSFGKYAVEVALDKDMNRIIEMGKKQEINKNIRKKKRALRKGHKDKKHEQEGG